MENESISKEYADLVNRYESALCVPKAVVTILECKPTIEEMLVFLRFQDILHSATQIDSDKDRSGMKDLQLLHHVNVLCGLQTQDTNWGRALAAYEISYNTKMKIEDIDSIILAGGKVVLIGNRYKDSPDTVMHSKVDSQRQKVGHAIPIVREIRTSHIVVDSNFAVLPWIEGNLISTLALGNTVYELPDDAYDTIVFTPKEYTLETSAE